MTTPRHRSLPVFDPSANEGDREVSRKSETPPARVLSVGFVVPFGEAAEGFFPDSLLAVCCARAREMGHRADLVRVFYAGNDRAKNATVRERLAAWLEERAVDLVVAERVFDPTPIQEHLARSPGRRAALISWGDGDAIPGFDLVIGRTAGRARGDRTRRSPSAGELLRAFEGVLDALAKESDPGLVPGAARVVDGALVAGPEGVAAPLPKPFRAALDHDTISADEAPAITRAYLFGNAGCPFADDPADNPHYAGLDLGATPTLARLGCAFCQAGGDYQKRPDGEVIDSLVEQAAFYLDRLPSVSDLVIIDQHATRYLKGLIAEAAARGLRPCRWLFSARADAFVRELPRVREAIVEAAAHGHRLALYLSGFESFSDRELARYNKGVDAATLIAAVKAMRALTAEHAGTFDHAAARGHSLILWSPWTTPEDILETTDKIRRNGLLDLFEDIGKNRLRLYEDLPITLAAARDGALQGSSSPGEEGAAALKGYAVERSWTFLDPRTRLAFGIARGLREALGPSTEISQLDAAARFASTHASFETKAIPSIVTGVLTEARDLAEALREIQEDRRSPRPRVQRARPVLLTGACNNGCATCSNRDRHQAQDDLSFIERAGSERAEATSDIEKKTEKEPRSGTSDETAIVLAGREPLLHPAILRIIEAARGSDQRVVGVVTNGRRLSHRPFTIAIVRAGVRSVSVKLFGATPETAAAITRDADGHAQALAGLTEIARLGVAREIRLGLHRLVLKEIEGVAEIAARHRVPAIRVEAALDAVGLAHMNEACDALGRLRERCLALGVGLSASRLEAGTRGFDEVPALAHDGGRARSV